MQSVPSFKTVRRTVLKFTLCRAPDGYMQGLAPHTPPEALPLDSAKGTSSLWKPIINSEQENIFFVRETKAP